MDFFSSFLHQKVPKSGKELPLYYRKALSVSEILLMAYFAVCFFFYPLFLDVWIWVPLLFMAVTGLAMWMTGNRGMRENLLVYGALCLGWVFWNVLAFGWSCGVQHFLTLMLVLIFFNVYEKPLIKIACFIVILVYRVALFSWSLQHTATYVMDKSVNTFYQTINTIGFFMMLAAICIIFSTSIQDTERELRLRNQTLYKEAGTDPLTGLPNRRAMIETIGKYCKAEPDQPFAVAIADIDFFKNVNDTYGHNCGDYTLVKLTELFAEHSGGRYRVCRWGGEEFCFFMPGINIDEAGIIMNDLCFAVERMKLKFEENEFSITITIGVEECDFNSPLEDLLKSADEKLYMGKNSGRNKVVV